MLNLKKVINKNPWFFRFARMGRIFLPQPFFLLVHLTLNCNCYCAACYQRSDGFYRDKGAFMAIEDFEKILEEAETFFFKPRVHLFGGEPLIHPDLEKITELLDRRAFSFSLTTNGALLARFAGRLVSSRLDQVNVSLDDLDEVHDKLRGLKGCFSLAIGGINKLRDEEGKKRRRKIININCLIGENNYFRLAEIADYFIKNKTDIDLLAFQHSYFSLRQSLRVDLAILERQLDAVKKMKAPFDVIFTPMIKNKDLKEFYSSDKSGVFKERCFMPWLGLSVYPNLELAPGGGVLGCNLIVGDLKSSHLKEVWSGEAMKDFRSVIDTRGLPASCARCCHRQYY